MLEQFGFDGDVWRLAVALGIGLLLGLERERRKPEEGPRPVAGVRTFALVALLGGVAVVLGDIALAVAGAFVAAAALAGYVLGDRTDPGLTTEVALLVAFLLGALAQTEPALAGGLGVVVTVLLSARTRIHTFVRDTLTPAEVHDLLVFAAAALVVLPMLPNEDIGPYGAFNPFSIWRLVVIVMAISGAGHIALRLVGPRFGLPVTGFISGFVSSTATVGAMGGRAADATLRRPAVAGAVLSSLATVIQMAIVVGASSRAVLGEVTAPLLAAGVAAGGYGLIHALRLRPGDSPERFDPGAAFDLKSAGIFAATVTGVLFISAVLSDRLGERGLLLSTAIAGFADAHAAAISAASLAATGQVAASAAVIAILAGLSTNALSKTVLAFTAGGRRFGIQVGTGQALIVGAAWASWFAVAVR